MEQLVAKLIANEDIVGRLKKEGIQYKYTNNYQSVVFNLPDNFSNRVPSEKIWVPPKSLFINLKEKGGGYIKEVVIVCNELGEKLKPFFTSNKKQCGFHAVFSLKSAVTVKISNGTVKIFSHRIRPEHYDIESTFLWTGVAHPDYLGFSGEMGDGFGKYKNAILAAIEKYKDINCTKAYYILP